MMGKDVMTSKSASISTGSARPNIATGNSATVEVSDLNRPIPHSVEYEDTYDIGTCYDDEIEKDWERGYQDL